MSNHPNPPAHPSPPVRRKRTFNSLSDATSSLALQTPTPSDHDPHYASWGGDYFHTETSNNNNINNIITDATGIVPTTDNASHDRFPNPFALPHLPGPAVGTSDRTERSVSPSKRAKVLAGRTRFDDDDDDGEVGPGSPTTRGPWTAGEGGWDVVMGDEGGDSGLRVEAGKVVPLDAAGCVGGGGGGGVKLDVAGTLQGMMVADGGKGPTANWARRDGGSLLLVYVCPAWREGFGQGSGGYVGGLEGVGGLGTAFEGLCVAVHNVLTALSLSAQAVALSDRLDLPLPVQAPTSHVQELTSVVPVRRAPELAANILRASAYLLGLEQQSHQLSDGILTLFDCQGNLRLVLPMSEVGRETVMASTSGSISVARRKATSAALEAVLTEALRYLEEEKAWLQT